ncbi:MAG: protease inhibitor I42 family protein [Elusimicrobia bacterium]|nr:protease inhibitor I42 family protein [Elusimicrobiota bacterium]
MKSIALASLMMTLTSAARAGDAPSASTATLDAQALPQGRPASAAADSMKADIAVGEVLAIKLPCNPTTGYEWRLKSLDRKIASPSGPITFQKGEPGLTGAGGVCVLTIKGVKPGRTAAILVYRRSWENGAPAKTFTARITVAARRAKKATARP